MRIRAYFLLSGLVILSLTGCNGTKQTKSAEQSLSANIVKADYSKLKAQVEEFNRAIVNKDFNKMIDWTHPKYIDQFGGREKTLAVMKTGVEDYKSQGIEVISLDTGQPGEVVQIKDQLFSIVTDTSTMKAPGGKLVGEITVIAVSTDGANWKFISGLNQERFNALFPDAAEQILIPEAGESRFIEND